MIKLIFKIKIIKYFFVLNFQSINFDVVLVGSMFEGGPLLVDPMRETIQQLAPEARLVRLSVPPVVGALLLGMQAGGLQPTPEIRETLTGSSARVPR